MVILVVFNSFNVIKNLKKPDLVARQKPPFYTAITHIDTSGFASKTNLAALKTEVDKIDTDKLKAVPDDLAKLRNVAKNDVV